MQKSEVTTGIRATIVITTYSRSRILAERSLPSALAQTYPNFEVIVVDDCSTDDTETAVRRFQEKHSRLKYIRQEVNKGLSAARNRGAREASGEFIVFLDDDNALDFKFLEMTVPVLSKLPPEYGGIAVGRVVVNPAGSREYNAPDWSGSFYASIDNGWLLHKEVFNKISYDEELLTDEDADFGIQFFRLFKAEAVDQPLFFSYAHQVRGSQKSNFPSFSFPSERRYIGLTRFLKKNIPTFEASGNRADLAFIYRFAGRNLCWMGKMKEGRPYLWNALKIKPDIRNAINVAMSYGGRSVYSRYWAFEVAAIRFIKANMTHRVPVLAPKDPPQ